MNFQNPTLRWMLLPERIRGMFNLNDPRWGRGEDAAPTDSDPRPEVRSDPHPLGHEGVNESLLAGNRLILTNSGVISTASWAGSLAAKTAVVVVGLETVEVLGDSNPI